jgi:hypothetical protein
MTPVANLAPGSTTLAATSVNYTSDKFITGINDTGVNLPPVRLVSLGKFTTGVNNTSGKFATVSTSRLANKWNNIRMHLKEHAEKNLSIC